jgi:exodeoxyribonuclease VIII
MIEDNDSAQFLERFDAEAYHANRTHLSKSMISLIGDCPLRFKWAYDGGRTKETDLMRIGTAAHMYAFEFDQFVNNYHVIHVDRRPPSNGPAWAKISKAAAGRTVLKASEVAEIESLAHALKANPRARVLLEGNCYSESTFAWQTGAYPSQAVRLKCRPDVLRYDESVVIDLKTTTDASPEAFFKNAHDKWYDLSVAITAEGFKAVTGRDLEDYIFLVVETKPPYICEAYSAFDQFDASGLTYLKYGQYRLSRLLEEYVECRRKDFWPSYSMTVQPMRVPEWKMKALEREIQKEEVAQ